MLRVTTQMTGLAGAPYYSTLFFKGTELAEAAQAAAAVREFWNDLIGMITAGLTIQVLPEVDVVDPATGAVTNTHPVVAAPVVTGGNAPLPKATQGLIRLRTSTFVAGRRVQGRMFIPALANDAQLAGVPSTTFLGVCNDAANLLRTTMEAGNADWVVWSRSNGVDPVITSVSTWTQFAVLRSRRD